MQSERPIHPPRATQASRGQSILNPASESASAKLLADAIHLPTHGVPTAAEVAGDLTDGLAICHCGAQAPILRAELRHGLANVDR
jgi:hypothetical protein